MTINTAPQKREYTSFVKGDRRSYDPATEGFFAYGYSETALGGDLPELAYGSLSSPSLDRGRVERDWALTLADHPTMAENLCLYIVPGVLCSRDGWEFVSDRAPRETLELAKQVAEDRGARMLWIEGDAEYISDLRAEFTIADTPSSLDQRDAPVPEIVPATPLDFRAA